MRLSVFILCLLFSSTLFSQSSVTKIAFGSCAEEDKPQPVLDVVLKHKPNYFIYLGDNIYGDTDNMDTLRMKYLRLQIKPEFQRLIHQTKVLGTWDDHDFGRNDAGKEYPYKDEAKEIFLDFFKEPKNSERRKRAGVYTSYMYNVHGKKLQIILLDGRTFRDKLKKYDDEFKDDKRYFYDLDYAPHTDTATTLLGADQWKWLEGELKKKADVRIIGSGSQFGIEFNGYEAWANFPHEQQRMLNLIKKTKANGVVFISGDVHYAEISKVQTPGMYPIYDVTASGITSTWMFATPNKNRIEGPVMENHFGLLTIDWKQKSPSIKMEIWDVRNNQRVEHSVGLEEISLKK
jgi:alkaline phosphatase D